MNPNNEVIVVASTAAVVPATMGDDAIIRPWLHGKASSTQTAYARDVKRFQNFVTKPLKAVTLDDLQGYMDTLNGLAPATRARRINAIKSLFTFAQRTGYMPFNVAAAVQPAPVKNVLAERILSEADVHALLTLEKNRRNHALLRTLYAAGLRVSEAAGLRWRDLLVRDGGGQVTVFGKGGKTRAVLLPQSVWDEVLALRGQAGPDGAVFASRKGGGPLTIAQVGVIVKAAANRAGLGDAVSPHWLRHAHASHALDRGAPIHLVQSTLGHASLTTTSRYTHARPGESSGRYLAV